MGKKNRLRLEKDRILPTLFVSNKGDPMAVEVDHLNFQAQELNLDPKFRACVTAGCEMNTKI